MNQQFILFIYSLLRVITTYYIVVILNHKTILLYYIIYYFTFFIIKSMAKNRFRVFVKSLLSIF